MNASFLWNKEWITTLHQNCSGKPNILNTPYEIKWSNTLKHSLNKPLSFLRPYCVNLCLLMQGFLFTRRGQTPTLMTIPKPINKIHTPLTETQKQRNNVLPISQFPDTLLFSSLLTLLTSHNRSTSFLSHSLWFYLQVM